MEFFPFLLLSVLLGTFFHLLTSTLRSRRAARLPPGPRPFPIVGNLLQLGGNNLHVSLTEMASTYGPVMHLKLGCIDTVVVSSPEFAKQVLQKHDRVFSSRHLPAITSSYRHNEVSVVWLPVNPQWRTLRKIYKEQIFSQQRLDSSQGLRQEKLRKLHDYVQECCNAGQVVNITEAGFNMLLDLFWTSSFSMDFADFGSCSLQELKVLVHGVISVLGRPNVADYFPVLKPVDPQGLNKEIRSYIGKLLRIFDEIIDERLKSGSVNSTDLLETLLEISRKDESELSRKDILHFLMDIFVAGIDTPSATVEWAMAELIHNPNEMTKARTELHTVIGRNQKVQESDISRLPYLQAVIKETFRLHPPAPFLVPHRAEADTEINGFVIPKNAQVLVNVWASGRDPALWPDPNRFNPGRFLGSKIDVKGQNFELIPFGAGSRICPGLPLAHRIMHLMVATFIHEYDWKAEAGIKPEEMNMDENFEFTLQRAMPLKAIPIKV